MATVIVQKRKRENYTSYIIYYKDPRSGERRYYKSLRRQKDAQKEANDLRSLLDLGKLPAPKKKAALNPLSFNEVGDALEAEWKGLLELGELSTATVDNYLVVLNVLKRDLGRSLLLEETKASIKKYRNKVAKDLSKISANRRLFIIKQVFKKGLSLNAVLSDPSVELKYFSEKDHERTRFILPSVLDELIAASFKTRAKYYLPSIILLGSEHGAARQEVLRLRWPDIDFDFGGRGLIEFFRTKNKRKRTEFLMPRTREALLLWREHQAFMRRRKRVEVVDLSERVFCHMNGTPLLRFDSAWNRVCSLIGLEDFHFHDLRHTFCSNLILSGAGLKDVKEMIGHSDIGMTDRYSHLPDQRKADRQRVLSEHYGGGNGVGNT